MRRIFTAFAAGLLLLLTWKFQVITQAQAGNGLILYTVFLVALIFDLIPHPVTNFIHHHFEAPLRQPDKAKIDMLVRSRMQKYKEITVVLDNRLMYTGKLVGLSQSNGNFTLEYMDGDRKVQSSMHVVNVMNIKVYPTSGQEPIVSDDVETPSA